MNETSFYIFLIVSAAITIKSNQFQFEFDIDDIMFRVNQQIRCCFRRKLNLHINFKKFKFDIFANNFTLLDVDDIIDQSIKLFARRKSISTYRDDVLLQL